MKLTKDWLKEAATLSSLYKGDDYYEEVAELKKEQNKYTAIVFGEIIFDVQIEENELDIDCFCTCDFDAGGLCEHAVAVCLNILDGQFEEVEVDLEATADYMEKIEVMDHRLTDGKNFYQKVFLPAAENTKDQFLQRLFENKELLRKNFIELIENKKNNQDFIDISSLRSKIFNQLISIEFGSILDKEKQEETNQQFPPINSIYLEEKAIGLIEDILNPYGETALEHLANRQLINAFMVYLGMFESSFGLPEPDWEEEALIDNFESETLAVCEDWQNTLIEEIEDATFDQTQINHCINLIFDRWHLHHTDKSNSGIYYDFKFFEPFIKTILSEKSAQYLKGLLFKNQLINYQTAKIALHCADLLKEEDWWLEIGENFAGNDPEIAEKLMQKYHQLDQQENFYRIAHFSFDLFPDKLAGFLLKYIHPKVDRPFYVELLKYYTNAQQDIEAFKELREFISAEEKEAFIQINSTNPAFYARLLAAELRFSEILELARTEQNTWEFGELIRPIINIYPRDIFEIVTKRTIENLSIYAANKSDYKRICKNLGMVKELKGMEIERVAFIKGLKKQFRNRPLFLEELRAAGF